jgi:hypothetical protein
MDVYYMKKKYGAKRWKTMRRLLLNLADKIYSKYGFPVINMYSRVLYKNTLYKTVDIKIEENENTLEKLTVVFVPDETLQEYLNKRKEIRR